MRKQNGLNNDWIKKMCEAGPMKDKNKECKNCEKLFECSEFVKDFYETLF